MCDGGFALQRAATISFRIIGDVQIPVQKYRIYVNGAKGSSLNRGGCIAERTRLVGSTNQKRQEVNSSVDDSC